MKTAKQIQNKIDKLQKEKELLWNTVPDSEAHREYLLGRIRAINSRVTELRWVLR
jgi:hypothetical protein